MICINNAALGDPHFIPRLLSEFCDFYLNRANSKVVSIEDAQRNLESAVQMYSYLDDKDYFNQHYKRSLANRLLHDTTVVCAHPNCRYNVSHAWFLKYPLHRGPTKRNSF